MNVKRKLSIAVLAAITAGVLAGNASAETRWEHNHPRQDQVLDRDAHLRREIREERREGDLTRAQAHRLMREDRAVAREDRVIARSNGGYITPHEQHVLNHQETQIRRQIPG